MPPVLFCFSSDLLKSYLKISRGKLILAITGKLGIRAGKASAAADRHSGNVLLKRAQRGNEDNNG